MRARNSARAPALPLRRRLNKSPPARLSKSLLPHLSSESMPSLKETAGVEARPYFFALRTLRALLLSVVVALFITTFLAQAFQIPSGSMEKTLMPGDYLLVDKALFAGEDGNNSPALLPYRAVERGDIVVFHYPVKPETYFVKRVVAVPGDRVRIVNKRLYV